MKLLTQAEYSKLTGKSLQNIHSSIKEKRLEFRELDMYVKYADEEILIGKKKFIILSDQEYRSLKK